MARNTGQMQNWGLVQEQKRPLFADLLRELERAPLRHPKQMLLQNPVQAQVRRLLRKQEQRLLRYEGRVRLRAQVQRREQTLLQCHERRLEQGPVLRPERGQERPLYPVPLRRLLQVPEQGPHKGQALVQASPQWGCHFGAIENRELRM